MDSLDLLPLPWEVLDAYRAWKQEVDCVLPIGFSSAASEM